MLYSLVLQCEPESFTHGGHLWGKEGKGEGGGGGEGEGRGGKGKEEGRGRGGEGEGSHDLHFTVTSINSRKNTNKPTFYIYLYVVNTYTTHHNLLQTCTVSELKTSSEVHVNTVHQCMILTLTPKLICVFHSGFIFSITVGVRPLCPA